MGQSETARPSQARRAGLVPRACLAIFSLVWVCLAIAPRYRDAWLLENLMTMVLVPVAVLAYRRYRISDHSYVLATVFLILHTIGSHYTYSEVPLGDAAREFFGWGRNHYDRFVHFCFGLLMFRPLFELAVRRPAALGRVATVVVGVGLVALASVVYEVVEWWVAVIADPDAGHAFLGAQGDVWDAQWDMALACGGGLVAGLMHVGAANWGEPPRSTVVRRRLVRVWAVRSQS